ncbi:MAG TPA: hypothetical protein ENG48_00530 [Candidatus Atribacteria bacterium]|nr:hypothetical protein [Candidatus Atribacteria bacterium]
MTNLVPGTFFYIGEKMKNKIFFFIYIATILSLLTSPSLFIKAEAVRYDPELNWQVLESPHFSIYFYQHKQQNDGENNSRNEKLAQEIANIAEETYSQINTQISPPKHHHMQKIAIIMEDFSDYALGFASSFPHRVIRLSLTAPTAKSFDMKFKSWLKIVIAHEYTHIAHFEMTGGLTTAIRALFGQIITPNALQPIWSIEGLAVYNETKFTTKEGAKGRGGRGIDARYDMYLRMAALEAEDQFNTLDQISGYYLTSWPGSTAPYIYGQSLIHFIAQSYGEDKVIALSEVFCEYPYLGFNYAFKKTLGLDLDELYQNWKEYLKEKYQTQFQKISSHKNLTKSQQLTNYHYWVDCPRWISTSAPSATEDKIAIKVSTPHSYPFIQIIDPSASMASLTYSTIKKQSLVKRTYGKDSSFSISPDGSKVIYSKLTDYNQFYQFYDLYLYDLKADKEIRLSEGLRLRDPDWSPNPDPKNSQQIVAVINNSGTNNLILINLPSPLPISSTKTQSTYNLISKKDIIYLTNFDDGTQIYQPSWSPDGDKIAFSAWHQGYQDIYILDLNSTNIINSTLQPIFHDKATDLSPCWSSDSKYLFFSSDRTGIYNIFAFSLLDKKLYQVTNVISGAFQPAPSPDGRKLAYIEYHSTGYELHLLKLDDPEQWTEIEYVMPSNLKDNPEIQLSYQQTDRLKNQNLITNPSKSNYPVHPYHPFASFWPPTYWLPAAQITENDLGIGFSTELEDVLEFYSLPITITYGVLNNNLNYNLDYYNYRHYPITNLFLQGSTDLNPPVSTPNSWWKEGKAGINIYFPFQGQTVSSSNSRSYRQIFSLGYQYEKTYLAKADNTNQTNQENIASFKLSYTYSDAEKYGFSISPEQGQAFSLNYEHADKIIGSNYTFDKFIFDGRKFIDLPFLHQVLSLRLVAGCTSRNILDEEKFKLGGHYSANNLANTEVDTFSLRGYKSSFLKGNNLLSTSLEYRFPIANIEHSLKLGPFSFFLERLSGTLFIDMGNAWESINNSKESNSFWHDFKTGIGAELKADFNRKYDSPFTLRLGAAKALNEPKGYDIYLTLGTSF